MIRCFERAAAGIFLAGLLLVAGCKSPPEAPPPPPPLAPPPPAQYVPPSALLNNHSISAKDPSVIYLDYVLLVENHGLENAQFVIDSWSTTINGRQTAINKIFYNDGTNSHLLDEYALAAIAGTQFLPGIAEIPLRLELDIPVLIAADIPLNDDFNVELVINLLHANAQPAPVMIQAKETVVFPYIREPVFSITAIAILKAELVNTRFRVTIAIDNPNHFPVELSAFRYELYGNGRFWADGAERNIFSIPAKTKVAGDLFLLMNFIEMDRNLLDQIINLVDVNYRFNGNALVSTGVEYLPQFSTDFDLSGYSVVLDN